MAQQSRSDTSHNVTPATFTGGSDPIDLAALSPAGNFANA